MTQELEYFIGLVSKQLSEEEVSFVLSWLDTVDTSKLDSKTVPKGYRKMHYSAEYGHSTKTFLG